MPFNDPRIDALITQALRAFIEQNLVAARGIDERYALLWEEIDRLITKGGKRIRPKLTILAYQALGGSDVEGVIPVAVAQEILHVSLLMHDDIIDHDYIRYGIPNIAGAYRDHYQLYIASAEQRTHYAHAAAILAGDVLLSAAHGLIVQCNLPQRQMVVAQQLLSRGVFEVAGGELLDVEAAFLPVSNALLVARYKTASYSFVGPLLSGAVMADAEPAVMNHLEQFALNLGIAYQLADDVLGVFGDPSKTGKSTRGDIVEGKRTFMVEQLLSMATEEQEKTFHQHFGRSESSNQDIQIIKDLFEATGALDKTNQAIDSYAKKAQDSLDLMDLAPEWHEAFKQFLSKSIHRDS